MIIHINFEINFLFKVPIKTELDVGPLGESPMGGARDNVLPVPISSIKEEDDKIDVMSVQDLPVRVYSVS